MRLLRVIDATGNKTDYQTEHVPRIGERIVLAYGIGGPASDKARSEMTTHAGLADTTGVEPSKPHYFRVKDVMYRLDNKPEHQAAILIEEESADTNPWHID